MRPRTRCRFIIPAILVFGLGTAQLDAQGRDTVYFTEPNNTISKVVRFDAFGPGQTIAVIVAPGTNWQGLVVRGDGKLFAGNRTHGGNIMGCDPQTGQCKKVIDFKLAEALDIRTSDGALIAVNDKNQILRLDSKPGCSLDLVSTPACLAGGYAKTFEKSLSSVKKLADVKFARGGGAGSLFQDGDIAVLSQDPPKLLKVSNFGNTSETVIPSIRFMGQSQEPRGLAFRGNGDILITTKQGKVLRYNPAGEPFLNPFATPGKPLSKIVVGLQGAGLEERVFVVEESTGAIWSYDALGGDGKKATHGVTNPDGVGIGTGAFVATSPTTLEQTLTSGLVTEWEKIDLPGFSFGLARQFVDPREGSFQQVDLSLCDPDKDYSDFVCDHGNPFVDLGLPNVIPKYVRAFPALRPGDSPMNPTGPPTFQVVVMETTATFKGIIEDHVGGPMNGISHLGYDLHPLCLDPGSRGLPGVFYSPGPGDESIEEGDRFIEVTKACNHPLGGSWSRSAIVPGAWIDPDLLTACEELVGGVNEPVGKLENLKLTLDDPIRDIEGSCEVGTTGTGGAPAAAFAAAFDGDLENPANWSLLDSSSGKFGDSASGGNGYVVGDISIEKKLKDAAFDHEFGTSVNTISSPLLSIIADSGSLDSVFNATRSGAYLFYFKNIEANAGPPIFSNGFSTDANLGIAVYQNNDDPTLFALFFDDGPSDNDFNDLVVTATGPVGTRCALGIALDKAIEALGPTCGTATDRSLAAGHIQDFIDVIDDPDNEDDFPADSTIAAQLKARAESIKYVLERKFSLP